MQPNAISRFVVDALQCGLHSRNQCHHDFAVARLAGALQQNITFPSVPGVIATVAVITHPSILGANLERRRYKAPARYDDEIVVRTRLKNVRESLVHFGYEVVRVSDSVLLTEGETTHIVTDAGMKVRSIPEKYMKVFREAARTPS